MALRISVIVCAHNEARYLPACLHSLLAQTRLPDEIVVVNNASIDATRAVALEIPHVRVVDEPRKGLVIARETGRRVSAGDVLAYLDADCRAPLTWLARIEARFAADAALVALSGPYRFYDWDWWGRLLIRVYDVTLAPATQLLVKHLLRIGTVFYGGNFAVRRSIGSAGSTPPSNSMVRTRTSAAGCVPWAKSGCSTIASSTPRPAGMWPWGRGRCSGSTCGTSPPSCCTTGRRTRRTSM